MASVLLLNLGGPAGPEEVRPFLQNLFLDPRILDLPGGSLLREPLARLLSRLRAAKVARCYERIGGGSPLLPWTCKQAAGLQAELERRGRREVAVEVVMRYTEPRAEQVLGRLRAGGERRAVALPLYPQECRATTGSSLAALEQARAARAPDLELRAIRSYHCHGGYLDAVAERIEGALGRLSRQERAGAVLLFSAHAVPVKLAVQGDPYLDQVGETVEALRSRIGPRYEIRLAFQSRSGPVRWVGPATEAVIRELGGRVAVVIVPISFVSDHIETLYEIDVLYAALARDVGIGRFVRTESLNDSPSFLRALADLVEPHLDRAERVRG